MSDAAQADVSLQGLDEKKMTDAHGSSGKHRSSKCQGVGCCLYFKLIFTISVVLVFSYTAACLEQFFLVTNGQGTVRRSVRILSLW